jgi:hypothetical protein
MKEIPYYLTEADEAVYSSNVAEHDRHANKPSWFRCGWNLNGWKLGVCLGSAAAAIVLVANIAILAWIYSKFEANGGSATIYSGTLNKMRKISTWSHLAINILSTILLAASNNCMECLVASTRAELDSAHRNKEWLQIGLPGMRTLFRVSKSRNFVWIILLITSFLVNLSWATPSRIRSNKDI